MTDFREYLSDHEELLRTMQDSLQSNLWTALPGIVQKVNLGALTVEVQPAIQGVVMKPDGTKQYVNLPVLPDVPIIFPRGGGYSMTFPVAVGDECLVVFASRCIDSWWQSGGIQKPYEPRKHDLSDGFAIIGPYSQAKKISSVSAATVQVRSDDGSIFLEVDKTSGTIRAVAPTKVQLDTPVVEVTGVISVLNSKGSSGAAATITGDLHTTGNIIAGYGSVNIQLLAHIHSNSGGAGNGGPPVAET